MSQRERGLGGKDVLFPFFVFHVKLVERFVDVVPASEHVQCEDRFRTKIGLGRSLWQWWEAQDELEVDGVFRGGLPL